MRIGVIGGGASGMTAAIIAASNGHDVTIIEHKDRIGIKIRSTGNGRCNFTNRSIDVSSYHTDNQQLLKTVLSQFTTEDAIAFFQSLGMPVKEKNGGYYPLTEQATTVLEVLLYRIRELGIHVYTQTNISKIEHINNSYRIHSDKGIYIFEALILSCGGKAASVTGSDGSGYTYAKQLGIKYSKLLPALVQVRAKGNFWKQLSGIRCDCTLQLVVDHEHVASESGELQITDYGISGIAVFQLSGDIAEALDFKKDVSVFIDLLPSMEHKDIIQLIKHKLCFSKTLSAEEFLVGLVHKKMISFILKQNQISPSAEACKVSQNQWESVIANIKRFEVKPLTTNGFDQAQVTRGGVLLSQLSDNLEVKFLPNCYCIGEMLNVDGICGGYNLHFAWASGFLVGKKIGGNNDCFTTGESRY